MISHYSSFDNSLALHVYLFFKERDDNNDRKQLFYCINNRPHLQDVCGRSDARLHVTLVTFCPEEEMARHASERVLCVALLAHCCCCCLPLGCFKGVVRVNQSLFFSLID